MTLSAPTFYGGAGTSGATATVSCTPALGETIYAFVSVHRGSSVLPPAPTISDTDGHVWTQLLNQGATSGSPRIRALAFQTTGKGNPTVISAVPAVGSISLDVLGFPGANTDYTNSVVAFDANGDPTATIIAVGGGNASFAVSHYYGLSTPDTVASPAAGFTSLANYLSPGVSRHVLDYALTSPPNTAAYTSFNGSAVAFMFEAKAGAVVPTDISGASSIALNASGSLANFDISGAATIGLFSFATSPLQGLCLLNGNASIPLSAQGSVQYFGNMTGAAFINTYASGSMLYQLGMSGAANINMNAFASLVANFQLSGPAVFGLSAAGDGLFTGPFWIPDAPESGGWTPAAPPPWS